MDNRNEIRDFLASRLAKITPEQAAGLSLAVYGAEPGSPSEDGLRLLASWTATLDQTETPSANRGPASDTEPGSSTRSPLV